MELFHLTSVLLSEPRLFSGNAKDSTCHMEVIRLRNEIFWLERTQGQVAALQGRADGENNQVEGSLGLSELGWFLADIS